MTKNLIRQTTRFQDFVQDLEVGEVETKEDVSVAVYDQYDLENYIEAVEYSWKDEKTITVKLPVKQVNQFDRGQFFLTVIAIQNGNVTNPVNCQVEVTQ